MVRGLKSRNEMDKRWQWRLEDIFPSDEAYEQGLRFFESYLKESGQM